MDCYPIGSMYGIFTYIYRKNQLNVGKSTIHGSYGYKVENTRAVLSFQAYCTIRHSPAFQRFEMDIPPSSTPRHPDTVKSAHSTPWKGLEPEHLRSSGQRYTNFIVTRTGRTEFPFKQIVGLMLFHEELREKSLSEHVPTA